MSTTRGNPREGNIGFTLSFKHWDCCGFILFQNTFSTKTNRLWWAVISLELYCQISPILRTLRRFLNSTQLTDKRSLIWAVGFLKRGHFVRDESDNLVVWAEMTCYSFFAIRLRGGPALVGSLPFVFGVGVLGVGVSGVETGRSFQRKGWDWTSQSGLIPCLLLDYNKNININKECLKSYN